MEPREAEVLEWVGSGATFGSLCAFLARDRSDETAAALAAGFLTRWLDDGLLVRAATGGLGQRVFKASGHGAIQPGQEVTANSLAAHDVSPAPFR